MDSSKKIKEIKGGLHSDNRGELNYFNDFSFSKIKRFYIVSCPRKGIIRAFHGHIKEGKFLYVISGEALVCFVRINSKKDIKKNKVKKIILSEGYPKIAYIPPGFANGIKSLRKNTKIIFFSTSTLKESLADDIRYPEDYWGKKVWD